MRPPTLLPDGLTLDAFGLHPNGCFAPSGENIDERSVAICVAWLRTFARPSRSWCQRDSYALKHDVESWRSRSYITNGALIEAARREGYRIKPTCLGSPNALIAMRSSYRLGATDSLFTSRVIELGGDT